MKLSIKFFQKKTVGFYLVLAGGLFSLCSLIVYGLTGKTEFSPDLDSVVFVTGGLAIAFAIASCFYEHKLIRDASFLLALYSFIEFIGTQANYIANLITAIDNSSVSIGFVFSVIFFFLAFVCYLVSVFLTKKKKTEPVTAVAENK